MIPEPSGLDKLLAAVRTAEPGERIEYRDPIAAHGAPAIPLLRVWLTVPRRSAFAVRTLEKIGTEEASHGAVLDALASVPSTVPDSVARDVSEAVSRLRGKTSHVASGNKKPPPDRN